MRKRILTVFASLIIAFSITGCSNNQPITVNVENTNTLDNTIFGKSALIEIGNNLWYDSSTKIVYWWNGYISRETPTPYYAPNGVPYRYNPETNTFEEIKATPHKDIAKQWQKWYNNDMYKIADSKMEI